MVSCWATPVCLTRGWRRHLSCSAEEFHVSIVAVSPHLRERQAGSVGTLRPLDLPPSIISVLGLGPAAQVNGLYEAGAGGGEGKDAGFRSQVCGSL